MDLLRRILIKKKLNVFPACAVWQCPAACKAIYINLCSRVCLNIYWYRFRYRMLVHMQVRVVRAESAIFVFFITRGSFLCCFRALPIGMEFDFLVRKGWLPTGSESSGWFGWVGLYFRRVQIDRLATAGKLWIQELHTAHDFMPGIRCCPASSSFTIELPQFACASALLLASYSDIFFECRIYTPRRKADTLSRLTQWPKQEGIRYTLWGLIT